MPRGGSAPSTPARHAAAETERLIAWLRIPALGLIAAGANLDHPNPDKLGFYVALGVFAAWSVAVLVWVQLKPVPRQLPIVTTAVDIAAFTMLALLSGGPFSQARFAYFLIPVVVAFRFRPALAALAVATATAAYLAQALAHPAGNRPEAARLIALHAGYLLWVGAAAILLAMLLARRTERTIELADERRRLVADVLSAEERERQSLADGLHDRAIQDILSARHGLRELSPSADEATVTRVDAALGRAASDLRETVLALHPAVLEEAGLEEATAVVAQRTSRLGSFNLHLDLHGPESHPHGRLAIGLVRELVTNAARHAEATEVTVRLRQEPDGTLVLGVIDNGRGFDAQTLGQRLAEGHIGLASQRIRVEAVGGRLEIRTAPGSGTAVEVRLPS